MGLTPLPRWRKVPPVQRMILLFALVLPAPFCCAQVLLNPIPNAISYKFLAGQPPRAVMTALTDVEEAKFQGVYDEALKTNFALDTEGDKLSNQFHEYRTSLIMAMERADPKVQAALSGTRDSPLTAEQSEIIRHAQAQAMAADPTLQSQWDDLTKKMTAHAQAIDAAMVKLDPTVAPILAKFAPLDGTGPGPGAP